MFWVMNERSSTMKKRVTHVSLGVEPIERLLGAVGAIAGHEVMVGLRRVLSERAIDDVVTTATRNLRLGQRDSVCRTSHVASEAVHEVLVDKSQMRV
jgi:hypothetical protein